MDSGYPAPIANWGWPGGFGASGIDAALYSRSKCYFFRGDRYIRVTRGDTGPGTVDAGYPAPISNWGWDREFIVVHFKSLLPVNATIRGYIDTQFVEMQRLFAPLRIDVRRGTTEDLSGDDDLDPLLALDVGPCFLGQPTDEHDDLFAHRNNAAGTDLVVYVVDTLVGGSGNLLGCATHPDGQPGAAIVDNVGARWLTAHEVGHVLGLRHVTGPAAGTDDLMWPNVGWTNLPPDVSSGEASTMRSSNLTRPIPF